MLLDFEWCVNVNDAYDLFLNKFSELYNNHCPLKRFKIKQIPNKPWLTSGIKNAIKKKNNMYKVFLKRRNLENESRYKNYKNKLTEIIRNAKKQFFNNKFEKCKNNMKETWRNINNLLYKNKRKEKETSHFIYENEIINDKKRIANNFNNFFVEIGPKLANNIKSGENNIRPSEYIKARNNNNFFVRPTDGYEILKIVQAFKPKTSTDCNSISMSLLRKVINLIIEPLIHVCNLSLGTGVFPDKMKIASVLPVYKTGNVSVFGNYRPISILPQFSKILEKLYNNRLISLLDKEKIVINEQYGFRNKHSTDIALLELIEKITDGFEKKQIYSWHLY